MTTTTTTTTMRKRREGRRRVLRKQKVAVGKNQRRILMARTLASYGRAK